MALAQEEFAGKFFNNGAVLSGVIEMNSSPTEEQLRVLNNPLIENIKDQRMLTTLEF